MIDDLDSIINNKEIYIKDKTLDIMQKIKSLSLDTRTPILLLSGINNVIPNSDLDYRPTLDNLKYDSIRNTPDTIKFLYKEEAYNPETLMKKNIMEVILAKDRFYNQYSFELIFINSFSAIFNMEEPES